MKIMRAATLFGVGGASYVGLELLWRGKSHGSMFLAGGTCFLLLGQIRKTRLSVPLQALTGAAAITGVELITGMWCNRRYQVWDYRKMPLNYRGQICLPYSLLWIPVSLGGMLLYSRLEDAIKLPADPLTEPA